MTDCTLYRAVYLPDLGYVVYRHHEGAPTIEEKARNHKVAIFVTRLEAQDYCDYRNEQTEKNGTDAVEEIER